MGALRYKLKSLKECRYDTLTKLYTTCICPINDYSGIWGFKNYTDTEMVQPHSIRFYLGVHRHVANCAVEGEMGWLSCNNRRNLVMLNLRNRLLTIYNNRLLHHVFVWHLFYDSVPNTWTNEISEVFQEIDMTESYRKLWTVWYASCIQKYLKRTRKEVEWRTFQ